MKKLAIFLFASFAALSSASASTFAVNAFDIVYGSYNGTVSSPDSFTWRTAGYFWGGNIDLTYNGVVVADVVTNYDDAYTLFTGDAAIGQPCAASACIAVTNGQTVSLYSTINSLNGGNGVCCDFNGWTPEITVTGVPEPETWVMMLAGFGGLGIAGYRRGKAAILST